LVVGVLRDELAADGKTEDCLAELLDVLGTGGEAWEVAEVEAGVVAEDLAVVRGGFGEAVEGGRDDTVAAGLAPGLRGLEPVADGHQLVDPGDDLVLLGERCTGPRLEGEVVPV
jgi:hypothetical protein